MDDTLNLNFTKINNYKYFIVDNMLFSSINRFMMTSPTEVNQVTHAMFLYTWLWLNIIINDKQENCVQQSYQKVWESFYSDGIFSDNHGNKAIQLPVSSIGVRDTIIQYYSY